MRVRTLVPVMVLALAACGGGAVTSVNPPVGGGGGIVAPTSTPGSGAGASSTAKVTLQFSVGGSHAGADKRPAFVSPSTTQFTAVVNTVNGGAPGSGVQVTTVVPLTTTGSSPNCERIPFATETCDITIPAPVGTVNYTFKTSDGTNDLGIVTSDETIALDTANTLTVAMQGIVQHVAIISSQITSTAALSSQSQTLDVQAYDADNNLITGTAPYAAPVTVSDPDSANTGTTHLTINAGSPTSGVLVTSPQDVVTLLDNGMQINDFDLSAFGTPPDGTSPGRNAVCYDLQCGVTYGVPNDIVLGGTTIGSASNGVAPADPNNGQQTVFFAQPSGTASVSGSEAGITGGGFSGSFGTSLDSGTCGTGPSAVASITAGPGTSFTITAQNVGICKAKLTESGVWQLTNPAHTANVAGSPTHDGTFWISVTSASIGINHTKLHH